MRLKMITPAIVVALAPIAASAFELENVQITSYQLGVLGDDGLRLDCKPAGRALRCRLLDDKRRTVAETQGKAAAEWVQLTSTAAVETRDLRRGDDVVLTLSHPRIAKDLVLRFAGLAASPKAGKGRQSAELRLTQPITDTTPPPTVQPRRQPSGMATRPRPPAGERDEEGPIGPGAMAFAGGATKVTAQRLGAGGAAQATVPMEHDSCGIDCDTHSLATTGGNLQVPIQITVACAAGEQVNHVSFQVEGQAVQQLVGALQATGSFQQTVKVVPHSEANLESTCRAELGGNWPSNNPHPAVAKHEKALLTKDLTVWGRCSGDGAKTATQLTTKTQLTCVDQDYPAVPVP
jgi:hypothetical protein